MMGHRIALPLALLALGCASFSSSSDEEAQAREARRLQYRGFSVAAPHSKGWQFRENEQAPIHALFRKPLESPTHSLLVEVQVYALRRENETVEEFGERLVSVRFVDTTRFERVSFEPELDASWGEGCLGYRLELIDKKAPVAQGEPLTIVEQGFACPHPTIKGAVLNGLCSERGRREELDADLRAEGVDFLRGVRPEKLEIPREDAPGTSASPGGAEPSTAPPGSY
jgi:hypothetical protein